MTAQSFLLALVFRSTLDEGCSSIKKFHSLNDWCRCAIPTLEGTALNISVGAWEKENLLQIEIFFAQMYRLRGDENAKI